MSAAVEVALPLGRVLKRRDAQKWIDGLDALERARARAERRRRAADRAFRIVRARAEAEGRERARAEIDELVARVLAQAAADRRDLQAVVPDLVETLVRQIVADHEPDALLRDSVRRAVDERSPAFASIRVSADRSDAVRGMCDGAKLDVAVEADPQLRDGDALLVLDDVIIEIGTDQRVEDLCGAFRREWNALDAA